MFDIKALSGTALTAGAAGMSWIETANEIGQLTLTVIGIVVGIATLWYTIIRVKALRKKGKK